MAKRNNKKKQSGKSKSRQRGKQSSRAVKQAAPPGEQLTLQQALDRAVAHHNGGRPAEAESIYQQILKAKPEFPEAWHLWGVLAHQSGKHDLAIERISKALTYNPHLAAAYNHLGLALREVDRLDEAVENLQRAVALEPENTEACNNLGLALRDSEKHEEALEIFDRAIELRPNYAKAHMNRGLTLVDLERLEESLACYHRAIEIDSKNVSAHAKLGGTFAKLGQEDEAIDSYQSALEIKGSPRAHFGLANALLKNERFDEAVSSYNKAIAQDSGLVGAYNNLGLALNELGRKEEAINTFRQAIAIDPDFAASHCNLGNTFFLLNQQQEAIKCFLKAIALKPDFAQAHFNFGNSLYTLKQLEFAIAQFNKAIAIDPEFVAAYSNRGNSQKDLGRLDEALDSYRTARSLNEEDVSVYSNYLMALHYHSGFGNKDFLAASSAKFEKLTSEADAKNNFKNVTNPRRVLRIGYVSPDLKNHPVGFFLTRVLASHDHEQVEVYCYSNSEKRDATTERIMAVSSHWRNITKLKDEAACELIRGDNIDVLVDLSGHTANNRLTLFAQRPAPVQVSWVGYFGTTGLAEMDYVLADRFVVPPEDEEFFTEQVWRLPDSYLCFEPPQWNIAVEDLPILKSGKITFGCFNNWTKISADTLSLWSEILHSVKDSRLLLKSSSYQDIKLGSNVKDCFSNLSIDPERILIEGKSPREQLLATYGKVDIALDPFPFGGGTTSVESLWMGVPVITMRGDRWVGRVSESVLNAVGHPELVGKNPTEYRQLAIELAQDLPRLAKLRRSLRGQFESSPLCNGQEFTRNLESAYRGMWEQWCQSKNE